VNVSRQKVTNNAIFISIKIAVYPEWVRNRVWILSMIEIEQLHYLNIAFFPIGADDRPTINRASSVTWLILKRHYASFLVGMTCPEYIRYALLTLTIFISIASHSQTKKILLVKLSQSPSNPERRTGLIWGESPNKCDWSLWGWICQKWRRRNMWNIWYWENAGDLIIAYLIYIE
jgi:hypothetical protein